MPMLLAGDVGFSVYTGSLIKERLNPKEIYHGKEN